jgi:hypothetical protein
MFLVASFEGFEEEGIGFFVDFAVEVAVDFRFEVVSSDEGEGVPVAGEGVECINEGVECFFLLGVPGFWATQPVDFRLEIFFQVISPRVLDRSKFEDFWVFLVLVLSFLCGFYEGKKGWEVWVGEAQAFAAVGKFFFELLRGGNGGGSDLGWVCLGGGPEGCGVR